MSGKRRPNQTPLLFFVADVVAIVSAYYATILVRFHSEWGDHAFEFLNSLLGVRPSGEVGTTLELFYLVGAPRIITILAVTLCFFYAFNNLYTGWRFIGKRPMAWAVIVSNASALFLFYAYFYLQRNVWHPRSFFASFVVLNTVLTILLRIAVMRLRAACRPAEAADAWQRVVLVGDSDQSAYIDALLDLLHPHDLCVTGHIRPVAGTRFDALLEDIQQMVTVKDADMIIVADAAHSVGEIMRFLELGEKLNVPVKISSDELDVIRNEANIPVDLIRGVPLVHFEAPSRARRFATVRESVSRIIAFFVFLAVLPLLALLALVVKLSSPGGAFFIQERMGVNRKPFNMIKFRTMRERAEEEHAQLEEFNESVGGLFKIREDPRVTPVGRFLRRFSLDELPQLVNVLRGEMTLVGPRPLPRRDFENYYEEWHYSRHTGMPGLTCLWQVSGRSHLDFHSMCILDVYYLRNRSWVLDLKIVLRTLWVVLFAKGAY